MPSNQRFSLNDALDLFLLDREAQNLAAKTLTTYRKRLTKFMDWCSSQDITQLGDLTSVHLRQYQAGLVKTMADVSAKNHMVDVKTFFKFCVAEELITESPATRVKLPRVVERLPKVLTADEVKRMYKAAKTGRDKALFLVMLDTGARCEETIGMDAEDVDIGAGTILIRDGKPRRDRLVYISPRTRKELLRYIKTKNITKGALWRSVNSGGRLKEWGISQIIERLAKRANVKCTPHKLRRTFVTTMLRSGANVYALMRISGHRSLEAMQPYVAVADVDAEQAHRQASPVGELLD